MTKTYRGCLIERGAYQGTSDDRLDRWYYYRPGYKAGAFGGPGHRTLRGVREAIDEYIEMLIRTGQMACEARAKGGYARARSLTPEQRRDAARRAARARWDAAAQSRADSSAEPE